MLERFRGRPEAPHLQGLLAEEMLVGEDGAGRELNDCLGRISCHKTQRSAGGLVDKAAAGELSPGETEELRRLRRGSERRQRDWNDCGRQ